jgi:hypothetical protein
LNQIRTAAIVIAMAMIAAPAEADDVGDTSSGASAVDTTGSDDSDLYTLPDVETMMDQRHEEDNFLLVPSNRIDSDMEWLPPDLSGSTLSLDPAEDSTESP